MRKLLIIGLALCLLPITGFTQERRPHFRDNVAKIQTERVSFITEKLQLTVEEAEKFWPIYNEYLKKREDLFTGRNKQMPRNFDPGKLTDEDLSRLLDSILDQEVELAGLKKDYFNRIRKVLPVSKVLKLHRTEQDFMNHMINKLREEGKPDGYPGSKREPPVKNPMDHVPG